MASLCYFVLSLLTFSIENRKWFMVLALTVENVKAQSSSGLFMEKGPHALLCWQLVSYRHMEKIKSGSQLIWVFIFLSISVSAVLEECIHNLHALTRACLSRFSCLYSILLSWQLRATSFNLIGPNNIGIIVYHLNFLFDG